MMHINLFSLDRVFVFCKYGNNCSVASLQAWTNVIVAVLEGCQDSKFLKILDVILKSGTEYSGFKSVDPQKWSLKLAAGKYKIKGEVSLSSDWPAFMQPGIDHMFKIPQMFPNPASRARSQYFLIDDSSN